MVSLFCIFNVSYFIIVLCHVQTHLKNPFLIYFTRFVWQHVVIILVKHAYFYYLASTL